MYGDKLDLPDFEVNSRNIWYVRTALLRGFDSTLDLVNNAHKELEEHPDIAYTFKEMLTNMSHHNLQWLSETYKELGGVFREWDKESLRQRIVAAGRKFDFVPSYVRVDGEDYSNVDA